MALPQRFHPQQAMVLPTITAGPDAMVRGPKRMGLTVMAVFLVAFFGWGAIAPLAGGAFAPGVISPDGSVRTVQHLEGGIVAELYVREGTEVAAGTPLVALARVAEEANVAALMEQRRARLAEAARLEAELHGRDSVDFPSELAADPEGAAATLAEQRVFDARQAMLDARRDELRQQVQQLTEQITGFTAQVTSATDQLALIDEEIADKTRLLEQGLALKGDLLRLRRAAAEIGGFKGEYIAAIAQARQQIGQAEIQLLALDAERMQEVSQRATVVRTELGNIEQTLAAGRDILDRTVITAPIAGIVNNLRFRTQGGVIRPGEPILDIVPTEEKLVIDVLVNPTDIDLVEPGMNALVHLTALSNRSTPRLDGLVSRVSAERIIDEQTGAAHYNARVEVERSALVEIGDPRLTVGMPAEVIIVSRERTMLNYLLQPLTDALRRAGREA
jgi:HlyD family secretion protein